MPLLPKKANCEGNSENLGDRSALPAGSYVAAIKTSAYKETKAKDGHYLALMLSVVEGEHKGRTLFVNLNLDNPSQVAVEIANKELNSICEACGLRGVEDSSELHSIPMIVDVKVNKKANSDYPPSNSVVGYRKLDGDSPAKKVFQDATEEQQAPEKPQKKKPWEK